MSVNGPLRCDCHIYSEETFFPGELSGAKPYERHTWNKIPLSAQTGFIFSVSWIYCNNMTNISFIHGHVDEQLAHNAAYNQHDRFRIVSVLFVFMVKWKI
jgi:hypothetical protein